MRLTLAFHCFLLLVVHYARSQVDIPKVPLGADIEVYYLEAPLFKPKYGDLLAKINAFHVGLGFFDLVSKRQFTIDYVATTSVLDATFPKISNDSSFLWLDNGHVNFKDSIDHTYWTKEQLLYRIDGGTFNRYACWALEYNATNPYYSLFSVFNSTMKVDWKQVSNPIFNSSTCVDFAWKSLQVLYDLGAVYTFKNVLLFRDLLYFTVEQQPQPVDFNNPFIRSNILNFYMQFKFTNITWENLMEKVITLFQGDFYMHTPFDKYYKLELTKPFVWFNYSGFTIPHKGYRDPSSVIYPNIGHCAGYNNDSNNVGSVIVALIMIGGIIIISLFGMSIVLVRVLLRANQRQQQQPYETVQ